MQRNEGSGTLQVIAVLLFLTALLSGYAMYLMTSRQIASKRLEASGTAELFAILGEVSALLEKASDQPDSPFDPVYTFAKEGYEIKIEEISSKIDPNWMYVHVLAETPLVRLCASSDKPLALQQYRMDKGFSIDILKHYKDFFTDEAFEKYLTAYGYVNLNNDDEFAIEKAVAEAGGDSSFAQQIRAKIRQKREAVELINQQELDNLLAPQKDKLADVIGIQPQWNVNHADAFLITSLLSYEPFKIKNASTIAASLVAARQGRALTQKQLVDLTGLDSKHRLFTWLGARSWFWSVTISGTRTTMRAVLARALPHADDTAGINRVFPVEWKTEKK